MLREIRSVLKRSAFAQHAYGALRAVLTVVSPTLNTQVTYWVSKGRSLNLARPETFDEKVSWLKLRVYNSSPLVKQCADKYSVRDYVRECGSSDILNELYGVYSSVDEVPWHALPNRFALKWNVGSGGNLICDDLRALDIGTARRALKRAGGKRYHLSNAELQYKGVPRRLLCERLLEDADGKRPIDYKFDCYSGRVEYILVCLDRETSVRYYRFDREWNRIWGDRTTDGDPDPAPLPRPKGLDAAIKQAEVLCEPFPYVRADFFIIEGRPVFGELTFTPAGGIDSGNSEALDRLLGKCILLPPRGTPLRMPGDED